MKKNKDIDSGDDGEFALEKGEFDATLRMVRYTIEGDYVELKEEEDNDEYKER